MCLNMGSFSIDSCTDNDANTEQLYENNRSKRPDFYPCEVCGRKFTMRAMAVHKRSCLETESCQCSVCKSGSKKLKWKNLEKKNVTTLEDYSNNGSYKTKLSARVKPRVRDILTGKRCTVKNGMTADDNVISFKLVEKDIIDKMVGLASSNTNIDSTLKFSESAAFNDHKYVSMPPDLSENSVNHRQLGSPDQFSVFMKLNDKVDHDCTRKIYCSVCNDHIYWESFGLHLIEHCEILDNNDLKCPGCDRVYSKPACILTHFIVHILNHPEHCSDCRCNDSKCIEARNRAVAEHCYADSSLYYCYICLTRFSHNQTVVNHMRLHTNEMPFTCTECNRSFRQIGNLQRHMTTHRGDRPHKCPDCCRSFADPATLRNHLRVHTGETPFVCTICKRGFTQVGNLKRHMALHLPKDASASGFSSTLEMFSDESTASDINPSDDVKCNANSALDSFENSANNSNISDVIVKNAVESPSHGADSNVKNRKKKKNQKMKVFTCEICKKVYAWHHDLVVHFRTHTGEKPFECDICGKRFAQSGAVRIHKERHHPDSVNEHDSS